MKVHGLARKTVIINERLIVSWAGNYHAAQRVLHAIAHFATSISSEPAHIESHLRASCAVDLDSVSIFVAFIDPTGKAAVWGNACKELLGPDSRIWVAGTGFDRFFHYARMSSATFEKVGLPAADRWVFEALALSGTLLGDEMRTGEPLGAGFGGLYEIATFDGGRARYIDDITYIFWHVTQTPDEAIVRPPFRVFKTFLAAANNPVLYAVDFLQKNGAFKLEKQSYFCQAPQTTSLLKKRKRENLSSLWQVNVIIADLCSGVVEIFGHVSRDSRDARPEHLVKFMSRGRKEHIQYNPVRVATVIRSIIPQRSG